MPATLVYTKAQAKASDAELAELYQAHYDAEADLEHAIEGLHRAAGDAKDYRRRGTPWNLTLQQCLDHAAGTAAFDAYVSANTARAAAQQVIVDHEATHWEAHGRWLRFFLVPDGHIHSSACCHSLHVTTRIGWLPELSGETEAAAVAAHGPLLCSKCFPLAPVEWTRGNQTPADQCSGSGHYVPNANLRYRSPRGICPVCGQTVSVTSRAKARRHKVTEGGR